MDVLINRKTRVETIISNREKDVDEVIVELTEQEHKLLLEKLTNITPERVFDVLAELGINIY
jgi:IS30 family transposase